ncbi:PLP-dependent aminotransferase family protein [Paenibacillus sp. HN-1]|uniref:aminotransferase-like domain-containing protein n=1 Tax=Paenibacillus TaxID=44249 RepID=UPI001CA891A8|nr:MULTISPECIES: PLP-dependent aminotransferase family protein [Paenibacillus]MBY9080768.1 PLP-dependent aminotransferase family protein [Paenibacillus sp. CGMCC 1.18879]MBY9085240.1 PLP-dependent aminotransferase family protein [Paenibacillus sinensis]
MDYVFSNRFAALQPSIIREILKASSGQNVIPFSAGNPAVETFPAQAIRSFTQTILEENPVAALQYGITEGYEPLRQVLRKQLLESHNAGQESDEMIIVSGAQQGIELACKVLCNEGDTIICESPSFIGSLNSFRSAGARLVGVPMEPDGLNIEQLEHALKTEKNVKLLYLIPSFQNPTGITTSLEKRKAIYALARKYGVLILEDNPYGELRFKGEDIPTIKSLDEDGLVIYVGSFSKILSPGLRVGFVLAPSEVIQKMVVAKQGEDVHTAMLPQLLAYKFMTEYDYEGHIEMIREVYRRKSELMIHSLEQYMDTSITYTHPDGGLFLWCDLPADRPMLEYCKQAAAKGVAVVPGTAFVIDTQEPCNSFRLNYSTPSDEQIVEGIRILGTV